MPDIKMITKLREMTGAGMLDCQAALKEANDDFEKAVEIMRKKGEAKAAKKADRETSEGVIALAKDAGRLAVVGVACETDFVARNADFLAAVEEFAAKLLAVGEADFRVWAEEKIKNELIVRIGENLKLTEAKIFTANTIGAYLHSNKKIAGVVLLSGGDETLANDLAMQVAAMSPEYLTPESVPTEVVAKEKEIYSEQLKAENKPEAMWEKILPGKINKFYADVCLSKQAFIKDENKTVETLVAEAGAELVDFSLIRI